MRLTQLSVLHRSSTGMAATLLITVLVLLLNACSPAQHETTVNVTGADFAFTSDKVSVPAGKVHFVFSNKSTTNQHELWVYPQNQPKLQDMVNLKDSGQDVDEKDYLQNVAGDVEDVPIGQTQSFDATLTPGTYEFGCFVTSNVDGKPQVHYALGMHLLLTVTQ